MLAISVGCSIGVDNCRFEKPGQINLVQDAHSRAHRYRKNAANYESRDASHSSGHYRHSRTNSRFISKTRVITFDGVHSANRTGSWREPTRIGAQTRHVDDVTNTPATRIFGNSDKSN